MLEFILNNWETITLLLLNITSFVITFVVHRRSSKRLTTLEGVDNTIPQLDLEKIKDNETLILTALKQLLEAYQNEKKNESSQG